jgi:hypothetical protein
VQQAQPQTIPRWTSLLWSEPTGSDHRVTGAIDSTPGVQREAG